MTLRLILMRHAKSDWSQPGPDHDRPLNGRGRQSATALGDWIRTKGYLPDLVLCSSAVRTRETCDLLDINAKTEFRRDLYHASASEMAQVLASASAPVVLMLGHNPGIAEFAETLPSAMPDHDRFFDYPTGATLVVDFDTDNWSDIRTGTGHVVDFVVPRQLLQ